MPAFESPDSKRVLYIEDSRADAELVRRVLAQAGVDLEVVSALDGDVEKRIRRGGYTALLVDHMLEEARGVDLVADLKDTGLKLPPTYVVSASHESNLDLRAICSGADGFIAKGSGDFREELLAAVGESSRQKSRS